MSARPTPPSLAERLLAAAVRDAAWRDSILGDLREEFTAVAAARGRSASRRWYWRQALAIGTRSIASRVALRRRPTRGWLPPDEPAAAGWDAGLWRDVRHAARLLVRQPGTSAVVVLTLALALATISTSFALLDAIVLRPYRFDGVDRLVMVVSSDPQAALLDRDSVTPGDFRDWRRESRTLEQLSASEWWDANLSGIDQPAQLPGFRVTADFFDVLGVRPIVGREFVAEEETPGHHRRVVLGYELWTEQYQADPQIVGRTIRVDGEPHEVIGVAPPGFAIPLGAKIWAPLAYSPEEWDNRRGQFLMTVGRLAGGSTLSDARAELAALAERQRQAFPESNGQRPNGVVTFSEGMRDAGANVFLGTMLGASVLLLLVACANIANLLLARGSERRQEFALRLAMGASRARLGAQLLIEASLLAVAAILLAMPLALLGLRLARASIPASVVRFVPGWQFLEISPAVFWFTTGWGALAAISFSLLPAWQTARADLADTLRQGARSTTAPRQRHWLRNGLATVQVAMTLALLSGSGLLLSAAHEAIDGDLGFAKQQLLVARLVLPERPYAEVERRRRFIADVLQRLDAIPAVTGASMVSHLPYGGSNSTRPFWVDGMTLQAGDAPIVDYRRITPEYFETMGIPLRAGRRLDQSDRADSRPVAVVSRRLVDQLFDGGDAVGRQFRIEQDGELVTIVGVVGDVSHDWFWRRRQPTVYRPLAQEAPLAHAFVVRTVGDPLGVAGDFRRAVRAADPDQPLLALMPMEQLLAERTAGLTFIARSLGVVAAIALIVAVMGLYGLIAFMVSRRTRELGVRLALGATRWQVVAVTTRQGLHITVVGVAIGVAASAALGRLLESTLFGVVSTSVSQLAVLGTVVAGVSLLASYLPARRTARLDPTVALRAE